MTGQGDTGAIRARPVLEALCGILLTVLAAVAALAWSKIEALDARTIENGRDIAVIKSATMDRYTASDAERDWRVQQVVNQSSASDIIEIERRLRRIERGDASRRDKRGQHHEED